MPAASPTSKTLTSASLRAAVEQGFLDYLWRFGTRALLTVRETATALGRVSDAGIANADFVIKLIESGEIAAIASESGERNTWRVDAASVRLYLARKYTVQPQDMKFPVLDYLRNMSGPELRRLAAEIGVLAEKKEARR